MRLPRQFLLLHRILLWCAPRRFRRRYGAGILRQTAWMAARARRRGEGVLGSWAFGLRDVTASVAALRWRPIRRFLSPVGLHMFFAHIGSAFLGAPRRLLRSPGFTLPALLSLSLGMGAAAGALALVDAAFVRSLPYPDAEELVIVRSTRRGEGISVSYPDFGDWRREATAFSGMAAFARSGATLTGEGPAEALEGLTVTAGLFRVLGVQPALGTGFGAGDDRPGVEPKVILSHGIWQDRFGRDPGVLGTTVHLDGVGHTVVGVMPVGFDFPGGAILGSSDLYLPAGLQADTEGWRSRTSHPGLYVVGRLADGRTVDGARAELEAVAARLASAYPDTNRNESVRVAGLRETLVGDLGRALTLLAVSGGLVLLVAAANVTGLFLARISSRGHEVAVRTALGAGRRRVVVLFLGESLWLGLVAGILGAGVAALGFRLAAEDLARFAVLADVGVDGRVLVGLLAIVLAMAMAVGLAPALRAVGASDGNPIRARAASAGRGEGRIRDLLVVGEVALAVALLFTGGLLVRSFDRMAAEDGGLDPTDVVAFRLSLAEADYPDWADVQAAYGEVERRLSTLPGVEAVGGISTLPFSGFGSQSSFVPTGAAEDESVRTDVNVVTPGYFETMGVPLLRGRAFGPADGPDRPPVVVVDERMAERFWPGQDPLGQRVDGWGLEGATVVGVVGHVRNYGVLQTSREELYMPHAQRPYLRMWVAVRGPGIASMASAVREAVATVDPNVPVETFRSMETVVSETLGRPRMAAGIGLVLALLAGFLAVTGVYALMSFAVARRTRELGVRMALGATARSVRTMVVRRALGRTLAGAMVGLGLALAAGGWFESLVYGLPARDPVSLLVAVAGLAFAGLAAALIPAVRASRTDPARVLREE